MKNLIYIKGTKEGLVLQLDDQCAFADALKELRTKVADPALAGSADVRVHVGHRYCTEEQVKEITAAVEKSSHLSVAAVVSAVVTKEECERRVIENQSETYVGVVRSGQVIQADGDLVVVGDVNPNGRIVAAGSIYVLGRLKGVAHAGVTGNREAVIAASWLEAMQLRIADTLETMTDELEKLADQPEMECAYLDEDGRIVIDRLQELRVIRPQISTFKGGR